MKRAIRQCKISLAARAKICTDYSAGLSLSDIARTAGVTVNTVLYHVRRAGIKARRPHYTQRMDSAIKKAVVAIAKDLGLPVGSIASRIGQLYFPRT
jgi:hypothetical protein